MTSRQRVPSAKQPPPVTSFSLTGEEYDASTFGGIGDYMRRKRVKLQNQDSLRRNAALPQIFKGHVMAVLGYTNPSMSILRQIVVAHGGTWRDFKDGGLTVVIATALPVKKKEELLGKYKFVTPDWVLECVKAAKIVAWSDYSLSERTEGQTALRFTRKLQMPKLSSARREELVKFALDIIKMTPQKNAEWEIPDSDDAGGFDDDEEGLGQGRPYLGQRPKPLPGETDRAPPSGQTVAEEIPDYLDDDYLDDIDEDVLWMADPDGQMPPPSHQPVTRYKRNFAEVGEAEEDEEEADVVCLIPITETIRDSPRTPSPESQSEPEPECTRPPPVDNINGADAYTVEALIGEKRAGKSKRTRKKFLVKWKGYDESEATWEWGDTLRADLGSAVLDKMVEKYYKKRAPKSSQPVKRNRGGSRKTSQQSKKRATSTQKTHAGSQQMIFSQITKPSSQRSNKERSRKETSSAEPAIQPFRHTTVQKFTQETLAEALESTAAVIRPPCMTEPSRPPVAEGKVMAGLSFLSFSTVCLSDFEGSQDKRQQVVDDIPTASPSTKGEHLNGQLPLVAEQEMVEDDTAKALESDQFPAIAGEVVAREKAGEPPHSHQVDDMVNNDEEARLLLSYQAVEVSVEAEACKLLPPDQEPVLEEGVAVREEREVLAVAENEPTDFLLAPVPPSTQKLSQILEPVSGIEKTPPSASHRTKVPNHTIYKRSASPESPSCSSKRVRRAAVDISGGDMPVVSVSPKKSPNTNRTVAMRKARNPEEFNEAFLSDPRVRNASVLNPDFLGTFFKESRLHYLSTSKAELRSRLQRLEHRFPRPKPLKTRATRYIMHIDFDCFFAAVSTRDRPDIKDKPVAICHGRTEKSMTSEIASCNYAARAFGVKNGMWMAKAKELCPDIVTLGYDLEKYAEASEAFYEVILSLGGERLQAVSVDEALVDISNLVCNEGSADLDKEEAKAQELARHIRDECRGRTRCEVSVGIGTNVVMARLAMRKAKPAGQYIIRRAEIHDFLDGLDVRAFPGIGRHTTEKIVEMFGSDAVIQLRKIPKGRLQQTLGTKTGTRVYELCRGIDNTLVGAADTPRESISIAINWGVRFTDTEQAEEFLHRLARAVQERMEDEGVKGRSLNFKVAKRAANAPFETEKFLGCGRTEDMNKTFLFGAPTSDAMLIAKKCIEILRGFSVSPGDIRGFTVGMKALEDAAHDGRQQQLQFLKHHAKAVERPRIPAPPPPELKPAAPVTIQAYVKPKVTTLFDVFGKRGNSGGPRPLAAKGGPAKQHALAGTTMPALEPPAVLQESPPPPGPPEPQDTDRGSPGSASTRIQPALLSNNTKGTPATRRVEEEEASFKVPPNPHHAEVRTPPRMAPGRIFDPQVPFSPMPSSTQFDVPSLSQIDMSCLEHFSPSMRSAILLQATKKVEEAVDKVAEESPPNSQWSSEAWNSLSPGTRKTIRAEDEAAEQGRRARSLAQARKNSVHPGEKQRNGFSFNRAPPGPKQNPPPPKRGVSKPANGPGKGRRRAVAKPPAPLPPVRQTSPENHPGWLSEPKAIGGGGYPEEDPKDVPDAWRAIYPADAAEGQEAAPTHKAVWGAMEEEEEEPVRTKTIVVKAVRKPPMLSLSVGETARSTDVDAVRKTIRAWVQAVEAKLVDGEARDSDLKKLCVFLEKMVVEERNVDKAARIVRWFLALRAQSQFWESWAFGVLQDAVREAAASRRIYGLQF